MKTNSLLTAIVLSLLIPFTANAQDNPRNSVFSPYKSGASPLFGKDIVIYDDPTVNQENLAICTAFNGWLFAALTYQKPEGVYATILQSTDNGLTWEVKMDESANFTNNIITRLSLTTSGDSPSNIKLYMGVIFKDTIYQISTPFLGSYNIDPFSGAGELLNDFFNMSYDIALCNDFLNPAAGSNPNSIGVLYSKSGTKDSIIFRSSSNGGTSLDKRCIVRVTSNHVNKVSLAYGVSESYPTGRYFAVWEEKDSPYSDYGHLYTAHSEPAFNSSFTQTICLDSLDNLLINQCKNPSIACQHGSYDNDSANITTVILYETKNPNDLSDDINGFYNRQSATSNMFHSFILTGQEDNDLQPDICFNSYDSTFIATYYNISSQNLPFVKNNVNLDSPDSWSIVTIGYNDEHTLLAPCPKVILNYEKETGANAWISESSNGNGKSLFDAFYSTYTGTENIYLAGSKIDLVIYPNPCTSTITIEFLNFNLEHITISFMNMFGQSLKCISNTEFDAGRHKITSDVSAYPAGSYLIYCRGDDFFMTTQINIIR